jgi:hypothetical protein
VHALFKKIRQHGVRVALASSADADEVKKHEKIARVQDLVEPSTARRPINDVPKKAREFARLGIM